MPSIMQIVHWMEGFRTAPALCRAAANSPDAASGSSLPFICVYRLVNFVEL